MILYHSEAKARLIISHTREAILYPAVPKGKDEVRRSLICSGEDCDTDVANATKYTVACWCRFTRHGDCKDRVSCLLHRVSRPRQLFLSPPSFSPCYHIHLHPAHSRRALHSDSWVPMLLVSCTCDQTRNGCLASPRLFRRCRHRLHRMKKDWYLWYEEHVNIYLRLKENIHMKWGLRPVYDTVLYLPGESHRWSWCTAGVRVGIHSSL